MYKRVIEEFRQMELSITEKLQDKIPLSISEECALLSSNTPLKDAHATMDKFREMLAEHKLGSAQIIIAEHFVRACIPMIYKDCMENNEAAIMRYNKINTLSQVSLVFGFRQMGKTEILVITLCILLIIIPNVNICLFANNKEATSKNRGLAGKMHQKLMSHHGYDKNMFDTDNDKVMKFYYSPTDERKVYSFAAAGDG